MFNGRICSCQEEEFRDFKSNFAGIVYAKVEKQN